MKLSDAPAPYGTPRKPGIRLDLFGVDSVIDLPPKSIIAAVRTVAGRAHNANDARLLLDVLGLLPTATPAEATS